MVLAMAIAISTTKTNNKYSMNPANGLRGTKAPERNVFQAKSLTCIEYLSFSASVVVETWIKPHRGGQKDILLLHHWSHFLYTHLFLSGIVWVNSVCTDVLSPSLLLPFPMFAIWVGFCVSLKFDVWESVFFVTRNGVKWFVLPMTMSFNKISFQSVKEHVHGLNIWCCLSSKLFSGFRIQFENSVRN